MAVVTEQRADVDLSQTRIQEILGFYESVLKPQFEPTRMGDYIILDPASLDYEVDTTPKAARARLQVRHPGQVFVTLQVGLPVLPYRCPVVELRPASS